MEFSFSIYEIKNENLCLELICHLSNNLSLAVLNKKMVLI